MLVGTESYEASILSPAWAIEFKDTPFTKFKVTSYNDGTKAQEYPKKELITGKSILELQANDARFSAAEGVKVFIWDYSAS